VLTDTDRKLLFPSY